MHLHIRVMDILLTKLFSDEMNLEYVRIDIQH